MCGNDDDSAPIRSTIRSFSTLFFVLYFIFHLFSTDWIGTRSWFSPFFFASISMARKNGYYGGAFANKKNKGLDEESGFTQYTYTTRSADCYLY